MQYRKLGRTNLNVSVIGFGAIKLPEVSAFQAIEAINRALDLGINFIDTARAYGDSEKKIGMVMKERRPECFLATKTVSRDAKGALEDVERSLRDLQTDKIDLYQLHSVSDAETYKKVMRPGGALEGLKKAKEQGKIDHIGLSMHRALETMKLAITSGEFETIQIAYSPIDQEGVGAEIIPMAKEHDMGVIIMKPLAGGQLSNPQAKENDPIVSGSLKFIISNPAVTTAIPGMRIAGEVEENVKVAESTEPMAEEEKRRLFQAIGHLQKGFCLQCGYCLPCEQGIEIPAVFKALDFYKRYTEGELRQMAFIIYKKLQTKPDVCIECGTCEERCPAGLPIIERLKEALKVFGA